MLQLTFNREQDEAVPADSGRAARLRSLADLARGERAVIEQLQLPEDIARRLMELGFLPGHTVAPGLSAPGGDPRVFRVDGSEVALRAETASKILVRPLAAQLLADPQDE
jgi:ferrous iron transport protein A